jgi:hypothetical protein
MRKKVYYGSRRRKPFIQHRYMRRIPHYRIDDHPFWGVQMEVLFRGFSHSEMFRIEAEIRDLIARNKKKALDSGRLKEVVLHYIATKPFKDEMVFE